MATYKVGNRYLSKEEYQFDSLFKFTFGLLLLSFFVVTYKMWHFLQAQFPNVGPGLIKTGAVISGGVTASLCYLIRKILHNLYPFVIMGIVGLFLLQVILSITNFL